MRKFILTMMCIISVMDAIVLWQYSTDALQYVFCTMVFAMGMVFGYIRMGGRL